jgi:hypothetical protein
MVTGVAMRTALGTLYKVTVSYREPTYEERTGPRAVPFRWTYTLLADSADHARRRALSEFDEVTRQSSVGWSRQVVAVDVREADPPLRAPAG